MYRAGAVLAVTIGAEHAVSARVRSATRARAYSVSGTLSHGRLYCQCAWGGDCKHVAAVLFAIAQASARCHR